MITELHDKAWELLEEKGLKLSERMTVRSHFASAYRNDYPFITTKHKKGEIEYYHSEIEEINHLMFKSKKEVIMANAIFENTKDDFNINDSIQHLKFTFRILGIGSNWT